MVANTDGVLLKLFQESDKQMIIDICHDWEKRTGFELEFDEYGTVIQRDVNNYIILPIGDLYDEKGKEKFKRKGAVVKKLSNIDYDLAIVNEAVVNYFAKNIPVEKTILGCDEMRKFQKITKITGKYEYGFKEDANGKRFEYTVLKNKTKTSNKVKHTFVVEEVREYYGYELHEKVHRCFASSRPQDGALYKKSKSKTSIDKTPSTPEHCVIVNDDVTQMPIPTWLDKNWYIELAKQRIADFI